MSGLSGPGTVGVTRRLWNGREGLPLDDLGHEFPPCPFHSLLVTPMFSSSETGVSGKFGGRIKGAKYRFTLQDGTWDFPGDAIADRGLIFR